MKRRTQYIIEHVTKGRRSLIGKEFKTISAVSKALKVGERVYCRWCEIDPTKPKGSMFYSWLIGYREFEQHKDSISYSRFPLHEY